VVAAVRRLESLDLDPERITANARRFDVEVFRAQIGAFVAAAANPGRPEPRPVG
jgi:hypothetical protein